MKRQATTNIERVRQLTARSNMLHLVSAAFAGACAASLWVGGVTLAGVGWAFAFIIVAMVAEVFAAISRDKARSLWFELEFGPSELLDDNGRVVTGGNLRSPVR